MNKTNEIIQWTGTVFILTMYVIMSYYPELHPYNIMMGLLGGLCYFTWTVRVKNYPQMLINVRTTERVLDPVSDLADVIHEMEETLGADGRVLVRASGTEPLVRVMVEAQTDSLALSSALALANAVIEQHGGAVEGTH
jgi:phosphomannomutase